VAILVRDSRQAPAAERVAELVSWFSEALGRTLPEPVVLTGDLTAPGLGLDHADQQWLGRHCQVVLHAAADLSLRATPGGEPWRTNGEGTAALLALCRQLGLSEWHHVSTAFVCGRRRGPIWEDDLACGQDFHNPYEQSKFEAERRVRRANHIRATIYRPAVIVGDSGTGYTSSYAGIYRFLELAARLAEAASQRVPRQLPLRLPLSGDETGNLVPVDWVSRAVVDLVARPAWHGRTFHLVARSPVSARLIQEVAAAELELEGVVFAGPGDLAEPSRLEQLFLEGLQDHWPYLTGHPEFLCPNTTAALPHLSPPVIDGPLLRRLIRFAVADRWGRARPVRAAVSPPSAPPSSCVQYVEQMFPRQARQSRLARAARLNLLVALDIRGPGGGQWSCQWTHGELTYVRRGLEDHAEVTYQTDLATFEAVVQGCLTPQQAFFEHRIAIRGDLETALKLAVLFDQFLRENPYPRPKRTEAIDDAPTRV
jgi:nucleoside-diphosphate-sugar epimerase/predicted lipid carrier protein YhbT